MATAKKTEKNQSTKKPAVKAEKATPSKEAPVKVEKHLRPNIVLQFQGGDIKMEDLVSAAISEFKAAHSRIPVVTLDVYVKPEEHTAYYVANGDFTGKIPF